MLYKLTCKQQIPTGENEETRSLIAKNGNDSSGHFHEYNQVDPITVISHVRNLIEIRLPFTKIYGFFFLYS